jgi:hypothetical protein
MNRPLRAMLIAAASLLVAPAMASATVLTTGTLTNAQGAPSAGQVSVYAWAFPKIGQSKEMPLLGTATAGADGRFSISSLDDALLKQVASPRDGWVDFTVVGTTPDTTGNWGFTGFVDAPGGTARVSTAQAVIGSGATARVASAEPLVPDVRVRLVSPRPAVAAAAQGGKCDTKRHIRALGSMNKMTIVGEINNAYNDGSVGKVTYGADHMTESTIGAAQQLPDGGWTISAEYLIKQSGQLVFPPANRRLSRKLRTSFEYTKYQMQASSCAVWEPPYVRATAWKGDYDMSIKQDGLDKCDTKAFRGSPPGGSFIRTDSKAVTYTRAVDAYGVNLTSRSGYSKSVTVRFDWKGAGDKRHYICGDDGKASAFTSPRIFTGSRK